MERLGGEFKLTELPRDRATAMRLYHDWIRFYFKVGGFTMVTIELPEGNQTTRVAKGIVSIIREGELC